MGYLTKIKALNQEEKILRKKEITLIIHPEIKEVLNVDSEGKIVIGSDGKAMGISDNWNLEIYSIKEVKRDAISGKRLVKFKKKESTEKDKKAEKEKEAKTLKNKRLRY